MFKVNNKDTKTRSMTFSGIFTVEIWRRFPITWQGRILFLNNFVLEILMTIVCRFLCFSSVLFTKKRQPHITYTA